MLLLWASWHAVAQVRYRFDTYAGSVDGFRDGDRKTALLRSPEGIAADDAGTLYITEYKSSIVRKIDKNGTVSLLAGQPMTTGYADGPGNQALFNRPHGLTVDKVGTVYVCDMKNHLIRTISPDGRVGTLAGKAGVSGTADGVSDQARFNQPEGVAVNSRGEVFVTDTYNYTIRKIDPHGRVTTLAGLGGVKGYANGRGRRARFNKPIGIAIDKADNLYVTDADYDGKPSGNCVIRKIDPRGNVTTLGGIPGRAGHRDGPIGEALFNRPAGVAVAADGTVFVADTEADLIRQISPAGAVTTLGGQYLIEKAQDGVGSAAAFFDPQSLVVLPTGTLFITDTLNNRIVVGRKLD
ncbi:hypothetical protein J2I47_08870 [Fibrella sp. HMF5335]|uniref:NHL repeat-containing protein n=1 Tax=Fibrella rubiginis TaxID=2817060 RepID=A0A939K4F5_9BACT|nr:hypothetical protein [Fibrella rubiginis]MBO0936653.1 hypothetical protein [Fibrella rubiginis]